MNNKLKLYIPILLLVSACQLSAQNMMSRQVAEPRAANAIDIEYYSKKKYLNAAVTVFGLNMGVWAFDRYALNAEFAKINATTIKNNFKRGFVYDNDQIGTNMFLHPYHGNLYYNAARSNGLNYWESGAFALGGSAMWEMFMENEYPSTNDIIATPVGGVLLGEIFHRSSDLILDDRVTGRQRVGREIAAGLINPMRAITRLVNGDAWTKRSTSGKQFGVPDVSVEIGVGVRALELKDPIIDKGVGAAVDIDVEYGDRFSPGGDNPYDYFTLRTNLNIHSSQPMLSQLNILGRLWGTEIYDSEKGFLNMGVYQHFDYYDSDTISKQSNKIPYKFCTPASFGVGIMHQSKRYDDWAFNSYAHVNGIILGGALSDYYLVENRNYNLASGFSIKVGGSIAYKDVIGFALNYESYRMFTWKGYPQDVSVEDIDGQSGNYQGDHSQAILHAVNAKASLKLYSQLYLTGAYYTYSRDTNYKFYKNVYSLTSEGRLLLTYKF